MMLNSKNWKPLLFLWEKIFILWQSVCLPEKVKRRRKWHIVVQSFKKNCALETLDKFLKYKLNVNEIM